MLKKIKSTSLVVLLVLSLLSITSCSKKKSLKVSVQNITITQTATSIEIGATLQLNIEISPKEAEQISVKWESNDPTIASVDAMGKLTALSEGSAIITVSSNDTDKTATFTINVSKKQIPLTSLGMNFQTYKLAQNETIKLECTLVPVDATDAEIKWTSSDDEIATVDENGLVTSIALGDVTITAQSKEIKATCDIKVFVPVQNITITQTTNSIEIGAILQLNADVLPKEAGNISINWESNEPTIASVDATGKLIAISEGSAIITISSNDTDKTATFTITVNKKQIPLTSLEMNFQTYELAQNETIKLEYTLIPADATDAEIKWTSSDDAIATVDETGLVKSIALGDVTITAQSKEIKTTCAIKVVVPVTKLGLFWIPNAVARNKSISLRTYTVPRNATLKEVNWTSSDNKIATVDKKGTLTGIALGKTTITATTLNGKHTVSMEFEVYEDKIITIDNANFKAALLETFDKDKDNEIWKSEALVVRTVDLTNKDITQLTGIEHFTNMTSLICYNCNITGALNLTFNTKLRYVSCEVNKITSIDVSKCPTLTSLYTRGNKTAGNIYYVYSKKYADEHNGTTFTKDDTATWKEKE